MIIRNTTTYTGSSNVSSLGIDNNGVVVKLPNVPSRLALYQSITASKYDATLDVTNFNNGNPIVIP